MAKLGTCNQDSTPNEGVDVRARAPCNLARASVALAANFGLAEPPRGLKRKLSPPLSQSEASALRLRALGRAGATKRKLRALSGGPRVLPLATRIPPPESTRGRLRNGRALIPEPPEPGQEHSGTLSSRRRRSYLGPHELTCCARETFRLYGSRFVSEANKKTGIKDQDSETGGNTFLKNYNKYSAFRN